MVSVTQEGHSTNILQSGQAECYSGSDMQRLRSETRGVVTGRWDQDRLKG